MSIGNSGRIVIEVEPEAKRKLYAALALDGLTLKEWFLQAANIYTQTASQVPPIFGERGSNAEQSGASLQINSSAPRGNA